MFFKSAVLALVAASTFVSAFPGPLAPAGCGTEPPSDIIKTAAHNSLVELEAAETLSAAEELEWIEVPTYIMAFPKQSSEEGMITMDRVEQQIKKLNEAFAVANIRFARKDALMVRDDKLNNNAELTDIGKFRKGGKDYRVLNVYVCNLTPGVGGLAHYPTKNPDEAAFTRDGVRVTEGVFAGSKSAAYNQGGTVVHEVGHWFGLMHTFEGGCDDKDGISDTPPQKEANFGCPAPKNSCPGKPGVDAISNYMNYADDKCKTEFTKGQIKQMRDNWFNFRAKVTGQ
jgi:hypothetical protein